VVAGGDRNYDQCDGGLAVGADRVRGVVGLRRWERDEKPECLDVALETGEFLKVTRDVIHAMDLLAAALADMVQAITALDRRMVTIEKALNIPRSHDSESSCG